MPIGRGHDRFPEPEAVRQGTRRHLRFVEIGCGVNVAHRDEPEQRRLVDELVAKYDVVLKSEFPHTRH